MATIQPFPHRYTVTLVGGSLTAPHRVPIAAGAPPQFGGSETVWSPEDLLAGAVIECLWTTFQAHARRAKLIVHAWSGTVEAILDRGANGPVFTSITCDVTLDVDPGDRERARELLAVAERGCIISNALAVPVAVRVDFVARAA